jgi:hypothetical protein
MREPKKRKRITGDDLSVALMVMLLIIVGVGLMHLLGI